MPSATLMKVYFAGDQAAKEGSANFSGTRDPALDAAMRAMGEAATGAQRLAAAHAFDRVFMWQHYAIPWSRRPAFNAAWWDRFGMPARAPRYFTLISGNNNANPWPIYSWWRQPSPEQPKP